MSTTLRETHLAAIFVALAQAQDSDAGIVDILHELALAAGSIHAVDYAGILLADKAGDLHVMASTSERADHIEILEIGAGDGPCVECFRTGRPVNVDDVAAFAKIWPAYYRAASVLDMRAVHALPLRLRETTIGALSLFSDNPGALTDHDVALAQALADVATIAIVKTRTMDRQREVEEQLTRALESRILVEQAKGIIAGSRMIPVDDAFGLLRDYARSRNAKLHDVARLVVEHTLSL